MEDLSLGEHLPLGWLVGALVLMLVFSAFFSIAETAMMAINRYRLKYLVSEGHSGAIRVAELLKRTDRLLGGILIGNTLAITGATTISGFIAARLFGEETLVVFLTPVVVGFIIIVFSEITPKVIGATHPEGAALFLSLPVKISLRLLDIPAWFINLFARPLLRLVGIKPGQSTDAPKLSPEEIRTLVLESSTFMPKKHLAIVLNLFDIEAVTVQDIMVPRAKIESVKLDDPIETIVHQLGTAYHMRLPVFRNALGEVAGVLHLRRVLAPLRAGELDKEALESLLDEPYFVPATTPALSQIQYFQENHQRLALVVDEYGELMGLVTVEDIIEEIIGKFTTTLPSAAPLAWDEDGSATADGAMPVREVNRALGLELPLEGPRTLNGLILEQLQDIPEADVSIKIGGVPMEIVHAQGRTVKTVRIFRPTEPVENVAPSET
ncbi:MAG TPA: CNNM domain-containing protein [Burkholderiales bacterium]|nr:CNNM domain-containing protein [Burkholderiales bacterium]